MMILYHSQPTGNSYKVRLLFSLLQQKYQPIEIDIFGANRTPEYLRINPLGKVPVLRLEDGRLLTESNAILYFLAEGTKFFPQDIWQRTEVLRWMFFEQYSHLPYIGVARLRLKLVRVPPPREDDLARWHERGNLALEIMDRHLSASEWLVGGAFSIADICLFAYTHVADEGGFELARYEHVCRWIEQVKAQPNFVSMAHRAGQHDQLSLSSVG